MNIDILKEIDISVTDMEDLKELQGWIEIEEIERMENNI